MRVIIIGFGVQGKKRFRAAGDDVVGVVDPVYEEADYCDIRDVPLNSYDTAIACIPDEPKVEILTHLLKNGKHVLVEKPLFAHSESELRDLETAAQDSGAVCHTAYNHRFEPHYMRMRDLIRSGALGEIYRCRMFYGNGTARLVRESAWRDAGAGVLPDLGSHLLDTAHYWFDGITDDFRVVSANCFENRAPDHVVIASEQSTPKLEFEMTLLSWRNHFTCDIFAERGTAHIESLCKWGPTTFTQRLRILPSGRPPEEAVTLVQDDPTWALEYAHFKKLCISNQKTDLSNDVWLLRTLNKLSDEAIALAKGS
ncbi:MAG: gfo/Idh/MocA family oxidoreductase [Methylocystaceae bacterium]|nr:gfo/Idh/MocA family oxidoreductase [Methylocystaceae bacterium]